MSRLNESHWVYGNGVHLDFSTGDPVPRAAVPGFSTMEGCAAISDDTGTLLFYTDGSTVWDASDKPVQIGPNPLGGQSSSTHSAIIVPPAGNGNQYHVFAVGSDHDTKPDLITHSSYTVNLGVVQVVAQPQVIGTSLHSDATERLAATSHADCDKYWVAAQNDDDERLMLFLVEGDFGPFNRPNVRWPGSPPGSPPGTAQPWAKPDPVREVGQMKFSPNGEYLAYCDMDRHRVVVVGFDSFLGDFTQWFEIQAPDHPYGLEFSPNSKFLYYSVWNGGMWQVGIGDPTAAPKAKVTDDLVKQLQLGPNGKIYGVRRNDLNLGVIKNPDQLHPSPGCNYESVAKDATGRDLVTNGLGQDGLPTFTRIADRCRTPDCEAVAEEVNDMLWDATGEHHESMQPCDYRTTGPRTLPRKRVWPHPKDEADCESLEFERPKPSVFITHSDSDCDCLESDDVEVMNITVCNRYSNITLTDLTIQSIELVGPNGGPPTPLPDGSPSVMVAPIGPFCFGDIEPCSCVSRQFVMRLRGAVAGTYKLKVTAMCFDWRVSESQQRCFEFEVCAD